MRTLPRSTVLILGRSGSGKSALVNALLGSPVRDTTSHSPSSQSFGRATVPDIRVTFFDGPGLEMETFNAQLSSLHSLVQAANRSLRPEDHFDAALIVFPSAGTKWESGDLRLVLKVVREWQLPLAIAFSRYEGDASAYERDPKADPSDELARTIMSDLERNAVADVALFRVNSVERVVSANARYPVAGLDRLARGLKALIDRGVNRTLARIRANERGAKWSRGSEIFEEAGRECLERCSGRFPTGTALAEADREIGVKMVADLVKLFDVEGSHEEVAVRLFEAYQEFLVPRSGNVMSYVQHFAVWVDYWTGSSYCGEQMRRLGVQVLDLLGRLAVVNGSITTEVVYEAIPFGRH